VLSGSFVSYGAEGSSKVVREDTKCYNRKHAASNVQSESCGSRYCKTMSAHQPSAYERQYLTTTNPFPPRSATGSSRPHTEWVENKTFRSRGVSGQFYIYRGTYKTDFEWKFQGLWVLLALS